MSDDVPGEPTPIPDQVESGPADTRFVEVRRFRQLDSTNRYLLDLARHRPSEGVVAVADHQTAGRGRLGRSWEAPAGANLLVSVLLVPGLDVEQLHLCNVAAALATAEACRQTASLDPMLKWPNDLVVGGRKLAGILAESIPVTSGGDPTRKATDTRAVVVGVGLNVAWPGASDDEVPEELRYIATSIRRETAEDVDRRLLLSLLLVDLESRLCQLDDAAGPGRLVAEYRRRCATIGQEVRVVTADGEIRGDAVDITPEGHLMVDVGACLTTISAGDVVHVLRGS